MCVPSRKKSPWHHDTDPCIDSPITSPCKITYSPLLKAPDMPTIPEYGAFKSRILGEFSRWACLKSVDNPTHFAPLDSHVRLAQLSSAQLSSTTHTRSEIFHFPSFSFANYPHRSILAYFRYVSISKTQNRLLFRGVPVSVTSVNDCWYLRARSRNILRPH